MKLRKEPLDIFDILILIITVTLWTLLLTSCSKPEPEPMYHCQSYILQYKQNTIISRNLDSSWVTFSPTSADTFISGDKELGYRREVVCTQIDGN